MSLAQEMRAILQGHGESGNLDRYAQMRGAQHIQDSINENYRVMEKLQAKHARERLLLQARLQAEAERRQRGGTGLGRLIGGGLGLAIGGPVGAWIGQGIGGIGEGIVSGNRAGQGMFNLGSAPMVLQEKLGQAQPQQQMTDQQMKDMLQKILQQQQRVYPQLAE